MTQEDRELFAELARLNRAMAPLALRIIEGSASTVEQQDYAHRLIAAGERLQRRVERTHGTVIEGEVLTDESMVLPRTLKPYRDS